MGDLLTPADVEKLAERAGIPIAEVCRRAGVASSIFSRWKSGKTEPNLENYRRIRDVVLGLPPRRKRKVPPSDELDEPEVPAEAAD